MGLVVEHRTPSLTWLARSVEVVGDSPWVLGALAVVGLAAVVALRAWRAGAAAVLAVVVATVAARVLKDVVERPRPGADLAVLPLEGWAMPSTHAARTAALTLAVLVVAHVSASGGRRWRWVVAAVVGVNVLVGVLMVYLGAHWPTDVVAGWVLGAGVGWAAGRLLRGGRGAEVVGA